MEMVCNPEIRENVFQIIYTENVATSDVALIYCLSKQVLKACSIFRNSRAVVPIYNLPNLRKPGCLGGRNFRVSPSVVI